MKREFSKILAIICFVVGIGCIVAYWIAIFQGLTNVDATLATAGLTQIVAAFLSYCLYQFGLKNSRNKYSIGPDGQPIKEKMIGEDEDDGNN